MHDERKNASKSFVATSSSRKFRIAHWRHSPPDAMTFFDTIIGAVSNIAPYHLWIYSTLLGTELYQTFVMTKVSYQALPRSAFTTLQKRVFPLYFQGQTLLLALTAMTIPPYGPVSLVHHKMDWIPFTVAGVTAILNLVIYEPLTRKAMIDRIHQGVFTPCILSV